MSDFVAECRREWKRLSVPDSLAEEMAADLASDLKEAEADGVSAEEFLGSSVFDPRSFAASWAAERGIIPAPAGRTNRPLVLVAFTALAAVAVLVAALLLATGEPKVQAVATSAGRPGISIPPVPFDYHPGGPGRLVLRTASPSASASAPVEWILLLVALAALAFAAWLWSSRGRARPPATA